LASASASTSRRSVSPSAQLGIRLGQRVGERIREGAERLAGVALALLGGVLLAEKLFH
jgi:hypothetical protein